VFWGGNIAGEGIVAPPQLTGTNGETIIKYPLSGTSGFSIEVSKPGYKTGSCRWSQGDTSQEMTFRLKPMSGAPVFGR
jgi:hypothetical protein